MNGLKDLIQSINDWFNRGITSGGLTSVAKITGAQLGADGAAYASGDLIGDQSPIKISTGLRAHKNTAILQSITIQDLSKQSLAVDVVIFDSFPGSTTFTDNAPLDIADADLPKVLGVISVVASDYAAFNDNSVATKTGIGFPIKSVSPGVIWVAFVSRGAPTYVADELSATLGFLQD